MRREGIVSKIKYLISESRSSGIGTSLQISLKFSSVQTDAVAQHSLLQCTFMNRGNKVARLIQPFTMLPVHTQSALMWSFFFSYSKSI